MANEFKLSYTASQVNEKLGEIENLAKKSEIPSKLSQLVNDGGFATENYVNSAIENIDFPETDLSGYALKSEIPTDYLTEIPAEYVTESELNAKGYLTQHQSLAGLATETFVNEGLAGKQPVGDYALKSEIPTDYLTAVPAEYVTEYELNSKGYLTEQSLDGLATETFVTEQIAGKADIGHVHSWNELTDNPFTEENALNLVAEMRLIDPATNEDGVLLTDENNKIVII